VLPEEAKHGGARVHRRAEHRGAVVPIGERVRDVRGHADDPQRLARLRVDAAARFAEERHHHAGGVELGAETQPAPPRRDFDRRQLAQGLSGHAVFPLLAFGALGDVAQELGIHSD
jgi:hypothetical protein